MAVAESKGIAFHNLQGYADVKRSLDLYEHRPPFYKANPAMTGGRDEDIPQPAYSQIIDYEI